MEDIDETDFIVDNTQTTKDFTIQRLKEFSYYLVTSIEKNLNFFLAILEDRITAKKSNSNPINALGAIATPIPTIGRGLSTALKEGEIFFLNKIDEKNAKAMASLIYFFNDNKEGFRSILIESAMEIFYCFEEQFAKLNCEGGSRRAMQKLAKDASHRIFTYFLDNKLEEKITIEDFSKGVLFGESLKSKFGTKSGKTVTGDEEKKWKTASIYTKVGIFCHHSGEFFGSSKTKSTKYGYRKIFTFEDIDDIRTTWILEAATPPHFNLDKDDLPPLLPQIREYIMKKDSTEEAMLDREQKHQEIIDDQKTKHDQLLDTMLQKFAQIFDELTINYLQIETNNQKSEKILDTLQQQQATEEHRHQEVITHLSEIHSSVLETKANQHQLVEKTESIQNDICEVKNRQEEFSSTAVEVKELVQQVSEQKEVKLSDLVRDNYEVKKVTRVLQEVKENLSDVEPRVRKEVQKGIKKLFRR